MLKKRFVIFCNSFHGHRIEAVYWTGESWSHNLKDAEEYTKKEKSVTLLPYGGNWQENIVT